MMQKLQSADVGIITLVLSLKGPMFTVSVLKTLYSGQITVWTQLINPNYLFIPTTVQHHLFSCWFVAHVVNKMKFSNLQMY